MLKGNLVAYSGMTTKIRAMKNKLLSLSNMKKSLTLQLLQN